MAQAYIHVQLEDDHVALYEIEAYKQLLLKLYKDRKTFHHFYTKLKVNQVRTEASSWDEAIEYLLDEGIADDDDEVEKYHYACNGDYISHEEFLEIVNNI